MIFHTIEIYRLERFISKRVLNDNKSCLIRSIILLEQGKKYGLQFDIKIGVKKSDDDLDGHSWIVYQGKPFMEDAKRLLDYTIMYEGNNFNGK